MADLVFQLLFIVKMEKTKKHWGETKTEMM